MASLNNRPTNQQKNLLLGINGKPQPLRAVAAKGAPLPPIGEKKSSALLKQHNAQEPAKAASARLQSNPSFRVPSLSSLRAVDAIRDPKRQKIVQELVRTGGKENGFMSYKDRPENVVDIYAEDVGNEALVVAYVEHIYAYLFHREITLAKDYMTGMSINPRMRAILVDWMVSVAYKFKMSQDTLFLSLNIVDRFLSIPEIDATKDELQLVGVTSMFIAGKFEEVYPPELEDYVFISDSACTKPQILDCEMMIVNALNFDFTRPLPAHFLRRVCKAAESRQEEYVLSKYLCELAQLHIEFVAEKASLIAAGAVYLSILLQRGPNFVWNENMEYYSNYDETKVKQMACRLFGVIKAVPTSKQQCIVRKYSSEKNYHASQLTESALTTAHIFFAGTQA